eukprot:jgi/Botrbrau1/14381/Bobra.0014s0032.2
MYIFSQVPNAFVLVVIITVQYSSANVLFPSTVMAIGHFPPEAGTDISNLAAPQMSDRIRRPINAEAVGTTSTQEAPDDVERLPLIYWIGMKLWSSTRGSARVDLVRPTYPQPGQQTSLLRMRGRQGRGRRPLRGQYIAQSEEFLTNARVQTGAMNPIISPTTLWGDVAGARIKLMRHVAFGWPKQSDGMISHAKSDESSVLDKSCASGASQPLGLEPQDMHSVDWGPALHAVQSKVKEHFQGPRRPWFDFGVGVNYEVDRRELTTQACPAISSILIKSS